MSLFNQKDKFILEQAVYRAADVHVPEYNGGQWLWHEDFGWWEPVFDGKVKVEGLNNYYSGEMDAKTLGLALSTLLQNHLSWKYAEEGSFDESQRWGEHYYSLRNHAMEVLNDDQLSEYFAFLD